MPGMRRRSQGSDMNDQERIARATERHIAAEHAMQSGVAAEMQLPGRHAATEPKHLRVGVNTALRDHASLVQLLITKGIITEVEYVEAIADGMETEQREYEQRLSQYFEKPVHLA